MGNNISGILWLIGIIWLVAALYLMRWHEKKGNLNFGTVLTSLLLGPAMGIIVFESEKENIIEDNNRRMDETHRRWFQLNDRINGERMRSHWFRTIPPPPPISQRKENKKDFKFFRG